MTPWLEDADVRLYHGDVLQVLRELPAESVDCVVTSPPYWGLRDYGQEGQLGLEPTPEEYVTRMVEVFREVRRVLAAHGTVWLNLGDSYAHAVAMTTHSPSMSVTQKQEARARGETIAKAGTRHNSARHDVPSGLKVKDLVGVPWRVAFALQADGWYLRSDIIWAKPNPMPESVTDRPTKAHEYVFLLSKQPRYFFDQEAVREKSLRAGDIPGGNNGRGVGEFGVAPHAPFNGPVPANRNIRSVWEIATQPYPEAHFATFPEELARRCIAAGTSERGRCPECGAPWVREVEREGPTSWEARKNAGHPSRYGDEDHRSHAVGNAVADVRPTEMYHARGGLGWVPPRTTRGWSPTCGLPCATRKNWQPIPAVVLDPFIGSGTVAHVARKLGRHAVGIDLNESYLELAARRLQQQSLFAGTA